MVVLVGRSPPLYDPLSAPFSLPLDPSLMRWQWQPFGKYSIIRYLLFYQIRWKVFSKRVWFRRSCPPSGGNVVTNNNNHNSRNNIHFSFHFYKKKKNRLIRVNLWVSVLITPPDIINRTTCHMLASALPSIRINKLNNLINKWLMQYLLESELKIFQDDIFLSLN